MNKVRAQLTMEKIYEKECKTCKLFDNGNPCGRRLPYKFKGRGFKEHELRNESCDAYEKKKGKEK